MMKKFVMACAALALSTTMAFAALSLDAAKHQGLVGEQPDGLIGAVQPSPEVSALVEATNAERLAKYKAIAAKNGTDVTQVQALAGKKLIAQTPSGEYILNAGGSWQQK
jgi:uncharacterized protein YdbL (DUF1318 family)